eukprot:gene5202-5252_t
MNSGIHRIGVGAFEITAIQDGIFNPPIDIVTGVDKATAEATLTRHFRRVPPQIFISAFLIRHAGGLALIDTGCGTGMGPDNGKLAQRLEQLGVTPAEIGTILITHFHGDHIGGLSTADGQAAYPNAELIVPVEEAGFWLDDTRSWPEAMQQNHEAAKTTLGLYGQRVRQAANGAEALPGITRVALPGHTPGHSGWRLSSGADTLLMWGDIVHLPGLQFARPDATLVFDVDPKQAEASRRHALDMVATDRIRIAGVHLDFPIFGHVERRLDGYGFVADPWTP